MLTTYPSGVRQQNLLAEKIFNIQLEHIVVGNWAAELINSFGEMVKEITAIPFTTFNEYPLRFYNSDTVELINSDNPTGHFIKKDDILYLLEELKNRNVQFIFNESFIDFAEKEKRYTLIDGDILEKYPNLVVIKSISKSYGVPCLCLGVLASKKTGLVQNVQKNNSI